MTVDRDYLRRDGVDDRKKKEKEKANTPACCRNNISRESNDQSR